jgi:S-formylglutathione hydrolase
MTIETLSETNCFGGRIGFYKHASDANHCDMRFSVFVPPQAADGRVPVVTFLSGLTCTEENFMVKSGDGEYDFGLGAGFYVNATEEPWSRHYNMYDYVTQELRPAVFDNFPGDADRHGLMGHSMGGHGAFTVGLRNPGMFRSLSAFAPICTTLNSPWGRKALGHYLGSDTVTWKEYDASEVARRVNDAGHWGKILVDQGNDDPFLAEQLHPEMLERACAESGLELEMRYHDGYDHGYYFISTFIEEHLRHHAARLRL